MGQYNCLHSLPSVRLTHPTLDLISKKNKEIYIFITKCGGFFLHIYSLVKQKICCRNYNRCRLRRWSSTSHKYTYPGRISVCIAWNRRQKVLASAWTQIKHVFWTRWCNIHWNNLTSSHTSVAIYHLLKAMLNYPLESQELLLTSYWSYWNLISRMK